MSNSIILMILHGKTQKRIINKKNIQRKLMEMRKRGANVKSRNAESECKMEERGERM